MLGFCGNGHWAFLVRNSRSDEARIGAADFSSYIFAAGLALFTPALLLPVSRLPEADKLAAALQQQQRGHQIPFLFNRKFPAGDAGCQELIIARLRGSGPSGRSADPSAIHITLRTQRQRITYLDFCLAGDRHCGPGSAFRLSKKQNSGRWGNASGPGLSGRTVAGRNHPTALEQKRPICG